MPLEGPKLVFVLICTLASGDGPDGSEIYCILVSEVGVVSSASSVVCMLGSGVRTVSGACSEVCLHAGKWSENGLG